MSLKTKTVDLDGSTWLITEMPAGLLRIAHKLDDPESQLGLLGLCVLDDNRQPLGDAAEDLIPLRHVAELLDQIVALSGLDDPKPTAGA